LEKDVRVYFDERDNYTPGWKFNNWELKGVPIRLELGPKDIEKNEVRLCKRNDNKKMQVKVTEISETVS
jgi:prolyl-tRNA synthetase